MSENLVTLTTIKYLVKERIGISSSVRDTYIESIIKSVVDELKNTQGITLDLENSDAQMMFVVDYSTWRYLNRDVPDGMPRHLQFRLHNLMVRGVD